mgnify:CR=1 FL=1
MAFDLGETVVCWRNVKDENGAYKDPATSMKITITDKNNVVIVNAVAMTKDATGKYHYDWDTAGLLDGKYEVKYTATDGTRITIEENTVELE